ncbi:DUF488 domain-containing protein [Halosquirtibacter xylanolyticus]|nr:DUF488 domain-containing protein [Prolixibacteraceae bacterium]
MYYRRKIILALLQSFEGELNKYRLQKLLFLFTRKQESKSFDFVPYKYGCYSFQANADLLTLCKYNLVTQDNDKWVCLDKNIYAEALKKEDKNILSTIKREYGEMSTEQLIKHTYQNYPYYATKSRIAEKILDNIELERISLQRREGTDTILFTIGYEGISLETYINKLLINDVRVLCDVRKNSFSMKFGFSKSQLSKACEGVGIQFLHIPEVGIISEKRKELHTQADYDSLFLNYTNTVLKEEKQKLKEILQLLKEQKRIALTCFEKNIHQCHRKHLAHTIEALNGFEYSVKHI